MGAKKRKNGHSKRKKVGPSNEGPQEDRMISQLVESNNWWEVLARE